MKKTICRITGFLIILLLILVSLNKILAFKFSDGVSNVSNFYNQDDNTIDVLFLGSSHCFTTFNNGTLWDEYGIASYDMGTALQPMWNSYYLLKEVLKNQKPELVVLEGYATAFDIEYSQDSRIIKNTYGMKWSKNKIDAIMASSEEGRHLDFLLDYSQYHGRYKELKKADFFENYGNQSTGYNWFGKDWKGHYLMDTSNPVEVMDVSRIDYENELNARTEEYYRKTIELAQENGIPIVVIIAPYGISDYEQSKFVAAERIAGEYNVNFVNYNLGFDELGLDPNFIFHDNWHMTALGAHAFTSIVGEYLKSNYTISDRRGDPKYDSWQRWADYTRQYELGQMLMNCYDLETIKSYLNNPNYWLIVSTDGELGESSDEVRSFMADIGITEEFSKEIWLLQSRMQLEHVKEGDSDAYVVTKYRDICLRMSEETYSPEIYVDNNLQKNKVTNGINVIVYNAETNIFTDSFGIDYDNGYAVVR